MRILAIRPEPGLSRTIAAGREAGLAIGGVPLFELRPLAWHPPPAEAFDALLVGSANALRHGGNALEGYRALPVHAVGRETAAAARALGFGVPRTGEGGLQALLDAADRPLRYLRLAGAAHVPLEVPEGFVVTTRIVYESAPLSISRALVDLLREAPLVLIHSGEAARHFAGECDRLAIPRERIALAALAPRIAAVAGRGWVRVESAAAPQDCALLELARDMCQEGVPTGRGQ